MDTHGGSVQAKPTRSLAEILINRGKEKNIDTDTISPVAARSSPIASSARVPTTSTCPSVANVDANATSSPRLNLKPDTAKLPSCDIGIEIDAENDGSQFSVIEIEKIEYHSGDNLPSSCPLLEPEDLMHAASSFVVLPSVSLATPISSRAVNGASTAKSHSNQPCEIIDLIDETDDDIHLLDKVNVDVIAVKNNWKSSVSTKRKNCHEHIDYLSIVDEEKDVRENMELNVNESVKRVLHRADTIIVDETESCEELSQPTNTPPLSSLQRARDISAKYKRQSTQPNSNADKNPPRTQPLQQQRYFDSVRSSNLRSKLQGYSCKECEVFYSMVGESVKEAVKCSHQQSSRNTALGASVNNSVSPSDTTKPPDTVDEFSRHRFRFTPPLTPEGYWDIHSPADTKVYNPAEDFSTKSQ